MGEYRIQAANVSKAFTRGERLDSLYSLVARRLAHPLSHARRKRDNRFWAIDRISFEIRAGECLGVIGHNGAGKSTLLKLLAGIMRPDRGSVDVNGRVSALIEVGAGFHPNLTGRENVYLNASILGIPRREAARKFDDIVDFAEVREHIDTPVKHYSSGMYARLGFAIAVHANPDVLLVDEVLSVGDQQFRSKCMERMQAFLDRGVAIVFVSHDLESVQRFCDRTLVLCEGRNEFLGDSAKALALYHRTTTNALVLTDKARRLFVDVRNVVLRDASERVIESASPGDDVTLEYEVFFRTRVESPSFGLSLLRVRDRLTVYESSSTRLGYDGESIESGTSKRIRCRFRANVTPGEYTVGVHLREKDGLQYLYEDVDLIRLRVAGADFEDGPAHLNPTEPENARPPGNQRPDAASEAIVAVPAAGEVNPSRGFLSAGSPSRSR